jgi:beta-lactamase regulating signal transducer with metallopeptidase domain
MEQSTFSELENQKLPNATTVLILGIASIVTCCCYGVIGIVLGVIGLVLASKDAKLYAENPSIYKDHNNLKTGKILCIIGIVLGTLYLIYMIVLFAYFGLETIQNPSLLQEKIREMMGQ